MAEEKQTGIRAAVPMISPRSLLFLGACALGLLVFSAFAVRPAVLEAASLHRALAEAELEIERQRVLYPLYAGLVIAGEVAEVPVELPCPRKVPLAQDRVVGMPALFAGVASTAEVELAHVSPQVKAFEDGSRYLSVYMLIRGEFSTFRGFILSLGELPSFERVETLDVRKTATGEEMELKIWLAIE